MHADIAAFITQTLIPERKRLGFRLHLCDWDSVHAMPGHVRHYTSCYVFDYIGIYPRASHVMAIGHITYCCVAAHKHDPCQASTCAMRTPILTWLTCNPPYVFPRFLTSMPGGSYTSPMYFRRCAGDDADHAAWAGGGVQAAHGARRVGGHQGDGVL